MKNKKISLKELCRIALFTALTAVCAQIVVPAAVPFTLQLFAVLLAAGLLGAWQAGASVLIYILLGAVGLPVFSGFRSGISHLLGATGGYITGFLFTAIISGLLIKKFKNSFWGTVLSMLIGTVVCYALGTAQYMLVYMNSGDEKTFLYTLSVCVVPFIIPDIVKIFLAAVCAGRLKKIIKE